MGVIYKLKEEVVQFIISQRQSDPLSSCRQLAESASQKFNLRLSKSSVHDVLKESGVITPRGRKPKDKFEIPQEKKKQIQTSLSQIKLLPDPVQMNPVRPAPSIIVEQPVIILPAPMHEDPHKNMEISPEYEGAGRIFFKAARWDLGLFSEENIKEQDRIYYLTYSKGVKVVLENNKDFFIKLPMPIERCIREVADGLINNTKPLILSEVSDEMLFKGCLEAQEGFKINNISIVDQSDHNFVIFDSIMVFNRNYSIENRIFVENLEIDLLKRSKSLFFSQDIDNNDFIENILNLSGFDTVNKDKIVVTLLINDNYENKTMLQQAADQLNGMFLRDDQGRLVEVKLSLILL